MIKKYIVSLQCKQETRTLNKKITIMKTVIYVIVMSAIAGQNNKEYYKNIPNIFTLKHQAENRFDEIVVEFENRKDEKGNFLWECENSFGYVAYFKSDILGISFRMEIVEREIEI